MTEDDWLCAYLLRFGTETLHSTNTQEGEAEFLMDMGRTLKADGNTQSAWWTITKAYRRRQLAEREVSDLDLI